MTTPRSKVVRAKVAVSAAQVLERLSAGEVPLQCLLALADGLFEATRMSSVI